MMENILVFPCGSEIAFEIARSLAGDRHFHLVGASSVRDHGRFVFDDIVDDVPWIDDPDFIPCIKRIVADKAINLIYPATDMAVAVLKAAENDLGTIVVSSPIETAEVCLSKNKTYEALKGVVKLPRMYRIGERLQYPIFAKPDIGHSSKGTAIINSDEEKDSFLLKNRGVLLLEFLPGTEYTVDCFSDRKGKLLFAGARKRVRTMNGISVNTMPVDDVEQKQFLSLIEKINEALRFRGAWFAQFKRDAAGELTLMEIAARFGGSSGLYRGLGVNFALLSIWDALGFDVSVMSNKFPIEMDRALDNKYKLGIKYREVFLDYDDTIVMSATGLINPIVMQLVFSCINRGIKVTVLSRHRGDLVNELRRYKIDGLFSRIIHIPEEADKAGYIDNDSAIFIDDSFAERNNVLRKRNIPVFGLDMVEALIK